MFFFVECRVLGKVILIIMCVCGDGIIFTILFLILLPMHCAFNNAVANYFNREGKHWKRFHTMNSGNVEVGKSFSFIMIGPFIKYVG